MQIILTFMIMRIICMKFAAQDFSIHWSLMLTGFQHIIQYHALTSFALTSIFHFYLPKGSRPQECQMEMNSYSTWNFSPNLYYLLKMTVGFGCPLIWNSTLHSFFYILSEFQIHPSGQIVLNPGGFLLKCNPQS